MKRGVIDIPVRRLLRTFGFDVERKRPVLIDLLTQHGIGTVLDVGANVGQYARRLRSWGYRGTIVSFEPLRSALAELSRRAAADPLWSVCDYALGAKDEASVIHVSPASVFSSIRAGREQLHAAFEQARPVATETVTVRRLDSVFEQLPRHGAIFLKIDTQGYEREVISGADKALTAIAGAQIETSLSALYEGEALLAEMVTMMQSRGFQLTLIEPVSYHPRTHALLQVDCMFFRTGHDGPEASP